MTDGSRYETVVEAVRERVDPDETERERLQATAERLLAHARAAVADLPVEADVVQVGSTARGTWTAGDRDIDVFVRFDPDLDRRRLERFGLQVGNAVLPDGREEYAEHPYVTGTFEGYEVDLVPCYAVPDAGDIRSAVDRTPFHNEYLRERLTPALAGEVRLFKQFLKGTGGYGSDLRTRGFSGYLTELLALEYGGFRKVLAAAADWRPPVVLDPADHATREFEGALVVVDPTDPARNVAAVVSATNVARLQHYARAFLAAPAESFFEPRTPRPLDATAVAHHLDRRGTAPLAVRFDAPDLVDDQLYPQLRRSLCGLAGELDARGFEVVRTATFADETAVLFVELAHARLPRVERHEGPPVHVREHAARFYETYVETDAYGPFVDGDRYVVERDREVRTARTLAEERLFEVSLGADVRTGLAAGYDVLVGEETSALTAEFGVELARYFDPKP